MVAVGPEEEYGHLLFFREPEYLSCCVVASAVPHDDGVGPPVFVFVVQGLDELHEEELEGVPIRISLQQTSVDLATAVEGDDEGDPRRHLLDGEAVAEALPLPTPAAVVARVDPALVDVDDPLLRLQELQELEGTLLSLHQTAFRVPVDGELDDLGVAEVEELVHHQSDPMELDVDARRRLVVPADVVRPLDELSAAEFVVDEGGQLLVCERPLSLLVDDVHQHLGLPPCLGDDLGDVALAHPELLGEVGRGLAASDDPVGDLQPLLRRELGPVPSLSPQSDRGHLRGLLAELFGLPRQGTVLALLDALGQAVELGVLGVDVGALE